MSSTIPVKYIYIIITTAVFVTVTGLTVILGWLLDIPVLKSVLPGYVSMKFNTATCFALLGTAVLLHIKFRHKGPQPLASLLSFMVFAIGAATFSQQLFSYDLHIDQLFYPDLKDMASNRLYPGRMSPLTALCFCFSGFAAIIISLNMAKKAYVILAQYLLHLTTAISFVALLGYFFHIPDFYKFSFINSMAIHTAFTLFLLSVALTLLHPALGMTGIFTGHMIGNIMARRIFFKMFIALLVIGYLNILAHKRHLIHPDLGIAILTVCFMLVSLFFIWQKSALLNKLSVKEKLATENLRMLVESAPYAMILSDAQGTIIHVNYQAEKLYGYNSKELIGKDFKIFMPGKVHAAAQQKKEFFFSSPKVVTFGIEEDLFAVHKSGKEFPVEVVLTPIVTEDNNIVLASIIDVTARRASEAIIKKQLIELQSKNQELEQFNYIASHDLQQPLRTVANYIMLLEEDYPEQITGEIKEHLMAMSASTTRMSVLVRSLLDFGKLGRDKKLSVTDCHILVNNVIADLNNLIKNTGAVITITGTLPVIYAYETELHQLFQNLINNAIKFSKKNTIPEIRIGYKRMSDFHRFYVSDNGIGIEPCYQDRIFNIFQRLNREDEFEGYGVGLANCRKITEMHGGKIWVDSKKGAGSTFKFTLLNLNYEQSN